MTADRLWMLAEVGPWAPVRAHALGCEPCARFAADGPAAGEPCPNGAALWDAACAEDEARKDPYSFYEIHEASARG